MNNFTFYAPTLFAFGDGEESRTGALVRQFGGTKVLLESMVAHGVDKIVFSSTAATYGEPERVPILEDDKTIPTNCYGQTKLAMEHMMGWVSRAHGLKYVALRYFNAAGSNPDVGIGEDHNPESHLIPLVMKTALGQRSHIGIVAHQHLDAVQQAGQLDGDVPLTPAAEVGADNGHDAAVQHRAGHTDTHALHLLGSDAVFLHLVLHGLGQVPEDVFTCIGGVGGHLPLFQQSARRGEQAHLGCGAAQVDAKCVLFHIHLPLLCGGQAADFLIVIIITYPFAKDSG